jgi:hypothetical protein
MTLNPRNRSYLMTEQSEWMKVMLAEIDRKHAEQREADEEVARREQQDADAQST